MTLINLFYFFNLKVDKEPYIKVYKPMIELIPYMVEKFYVFLLEIIHYTIYFYKKEKKHFFIYLFIA